jgi:hypothetical protein
VLFSHPEVARFIRENFVAAWESVRPVPVATIDFGNGVTLKRTINGNIATYLCTPDGRVLDIIPGLNSPEAYLSGLNQGLALWKTHRGDADAIRAYHRAAPLLGGLAALDATKDRVEAPMKVSLANARKFSIEGPVKERMSDAALLVLDTETNRTVRKPLIHGILAEQAWRPAELTRRVYRDVLNCDLDDPYLGLVTKAFEGGGYEGR